MTDLLQSKLVVLRDNLEHLAQLPQDSFAEFSADFRTLDSALHRLQRERAAYAPSYRGCGIACLVCYPRRVVRSTLVLVLVLCVAAPAASQVPATPSRTSVVAGTNEVAPAVAECGRGWTVLVQTRIELESSGRTVAVTVTGNVPAAVAACVESKVMLMRVPPFSQARFVVSYPFRI